MKLLENELIREYFGCAVCDPHYHDLPSGCPFMAKSILQAMCDPIKKGESWLELYDGKVELNEGYDDDRFDPLHPYFLRLPDKFQPKRECCVSIQQDCPKCGYVHVWNPDFSAKPTYQKEKKPDPVCKHEGLKRYCWEAIYCESCMVDISKEMDKCVKTVPHDGPCEIKPDPVEAKIDKLTEYFRTYAAIHHQPVWFKAELRELVELARKP